MGLSDGPGDWGLAGGGLWTLEVAYLHLLPSHHDYLPPVTNNNECKDNPGSSRGALAVVARKPPLTF